MSASKPTYFLDTNIFLRFYTADVPEQSEECTKLLQMVKDGKIKVVTSTHVLSEILYTLRKYDVPKSEALTVVRYVMTFTGLKLIEDVDTSYAVVKYMTNNVKFVDCLISSHKLIREGKCPVISYDKDFDKLKVKRLEPADIIN